MTTPSIHDGAALRQAAWVLLGEGHGFLRWAEDPAPALLVSDANRQAARQGADVDSWLAPLRTAGWRVGLADDLVWLDAPEAAYQAVLTARLTNAPLPKAAPAELVALCQALLRQPAEQADTPAARALLRGAWRGLAQGEAHVCAWANRLRVTAAVLMRQGRRDGLYACGVLLWRRLSL